MGWPGTATLRPVWFLSPLTPQTDTADTSCTCLPQAYGAIDPDGTRFLFGDHDGRLHVMVIKYDAHNRAEQLVMQVIHLVSYILCYAHRVMHIV